jgi:hypothetical protein
MKHFRLAFAVALLGAGSAAASPAGDIAGTWECRLPGVQYRNKPPILYVADAGADQVTIEVDGFSREIYGRSEVSAADQSGWWKVKPAQGQEFQIRPEGMPAKQKTASMGLRFADAKGDYRCLRLPLSGTPAAASAGAPAAPGAPAAESAPPAAAEPSPAPAPSGEQPAPQPAMPVEGAVKKDY